MDKMNGAMRSGAMTDQVIGTVETISPLSIRLDPKVVIYEDQIMTRAGAREYAQDTTDNDGDGYFNFRHTHQIKGKTNPGGDGHTHDIDIISQAALSYVRMWRGLRPGDEVLMTRANNGARYIIEERLEGYSNQDTVAQETP